MSQILSSLSILLAVFTFFYSSWYDDFKRAMTMDVPLHYEDGKSKHIFVKEILHRRALPLLLMSSIIAFIFIPDSIKIILTSLHTYNSSGFMNSLKRYDSVETTIVLVDIIITLFALHMCGIYKQIHSKHSAFKKKKNQSA